MAFFSPAGPRKLRLANYEAICSLQDNQAQTCKFVIIAL
jgi:hypothetical protein